MPQPMPSPRNSLSAYLLILLAAFVLAACNSQKTSDGKLRLEPCTTAGIAGQCGKLTVYEDREAHQGRTLDLNLILIPAKNSPAAPDPLFYLAGGPGGGASQFIGSAVSQFAEINQTRDLVYVDQRGTGLSNFMLCPEAQAGENAAESITHCLSNLGHDPRFYTTAISMADLDEVRQALGYAQINLYGMSYGVTAAQVYLNRYPEHVRSVILDHGALLQIPFADNWARNSQLGLERVFARCQADPACQQAYPNLPAEFATLLAKLENPVPSGLFDPDTVQQIVFTRATFGSTLHYLMMDANTAATLPYLIHKAAGGDWSGLAKEYLKSTKTAAFQLRRVVMTLEILCHEPWWGGDLANIRRLGEGSYYLDTALADQQYIQSICAQLPAPDASAQHGPALPSDTPVLLLTGEIDPQDNIEGLAGYQDLWPNSRLVVQPGVSHNYTPDPCWNSIMASFVAQASVQALPLACVSEYTPPAFK